MIKKTKEEMQKEGKVGVGAKVAKKEKAQLPLSKPEVAQTAHKKVRDKSTVATKLVKIRQVRSGIGCIKSQIDTLKGLRLGRINKVSELEDTGSIRGMINKVKHLVQVI